MEKHWTILFLYLHKKESWSKDDILEAIKIRKEIIDRWKKRNDSFKLFKQSRLSYSPGYYSLGKEE